MACDRCKDLERKLAFVYGEFEALRELANKLIPQYEMLGIDKIPAYTNADAIADRVLGRKCSTCDRRGCSPMEHAGWHPEE